MTSSDAARTLRLRCLLSLRVGWCRWLQGVRRPPMSGSGRVGNELWRPVAPPVFARQWPSAQDREAGIGMLTAASGGPNERQVVALQISRPPGDGPTGQHLVQDLGR